MTGRLNTFFVSLLTAGLFFAGQAQAEEDKSMGLFLNLSSIQTGTAGHALHFAGKQMERGHPVTIFLNGPAVLFASKSAPQASVPIEGKTIRDMLDGMVKDGATLIMCQMCAKMRGMDSSDFIDGAVLGNPELVASSLFDPKYQVISW